MHILSAVYDINASKEKLKTKSMQHYYKGL